jgi:hypothetical protein
LSTSLFSLFLSLAHQCVRRAAAFRIAEDADHDDIHIRGHRDVNALFQWDVQWIEDQ